MEKGTNSIAMIKYRIERHRMMGNGTMCQKLKVELNKMLQQAR